MSSYQCSVKNVIQLNDQVYRIRVVPSDITLLDFKAGQYILLCMPVENNENMKIPLSIASAPEEKYFLELHIRITHENSLAEKMIEHFKHSNSIEIEGAFGDCYLNNEMENIILIAGGTGFTPMKSMIESCIANVQNKTRTIKLYLGAQHENELYQNQLIESWQSQYSSFQYVPVISGTSDNWQGETGFPHEIAIKQCDDFTDKDFFIGGSEAMVMTVYQALLKEGVDKKNIHSDMLDIKRASGKLD